MHPVRVGLVGIENSHAEHILRHLGLDEAPPLRATAIVAGDPERTARLAALGGVERVVDDVRALAGEVDAVIVTTRDGATHRDLAVPFLDAGVPVWVDKPFATTRADAEAMVAAAARGGALVTSSSTLRWLPDTDAVSAALPGIGPVRRLTVSGPADPDGPFGGLFFYGIHHADLAQRLVPGEPEDLRVAAHDRGLLARYRCGEVEVALEFVRPAFDAPFHVTVEGAKGSIDREIAVGGDYVRTALQAFARMISARSTAVPTAEMLAAVTVVEKAIALAGE